MFWLYLYSILSIIFLVYMMHRLFKIKSKNIDLFNRYSEVKLNATVVDERILKK